MSVDQNKTNPRHRRHLLHSVGILPSNLTLEDTTKLSISTLFFHRIPWIVIGLFGAFLAVFTVESFNNVLEENIVLAAFIPLIVYISAAVGGQTQTLFVRDLTLIKTASLIKYVFKQALTTALISIVCSVIVFIGAILLGTTSQISLIVSFATFFAINSSTVIALFIPYLLSTRGQDPAIGSGPFTTVLQDTFTILIYFVIASYLI